MKKKLPLSLLCLLFLVAAGIFGFRYVSQNQQYRAGENAYTALAQYVTPQPEIPAAEVVEKPQPGSQSGSYVDFAGLRQQNPDTVAWITLEGTAIHYPVVQGKDNSYYLNRLPDGSVNRAGSIFMDYRNESDLSQRNTILYGHHMQNGTMFQPITGYKDQKFYEEHPTALLMTPQGNYTIEFFAGYVTDLNSQAWKLEFGSDAEFEEWIGNAISRSAFTSTLSPTPQDRVVTLSTCTYEYDDARFVLLGVLKKSV